MERKSVSVIVLILLLIGVLTVAFNINPLKAEPGTIYVDDDNTGGPWDGSQAHPYQNITSALQHASVDDTIYVYNGVYRENVVIDQTLTLMGESRSNTIINGSGLSYEGGLVAIAAANNVDISGFTVTNALHQGISVGGSWYCVVHDTIVCFTGEGGADRGIVFGSGGNHSAYNNVVYNSTGWGGIDAIYSDNNTIYNNLVYFNHWGISTNHGSYNRIYNNTVHSNRETGINIDWPSTGNIVRNNNVSSNTNDGIRLMHQNETVISGNKISENDCGIFLGSSPNNTISGNYITNNAGAVTIVSSGNNSFYHNNFINNGWQVIVDMYTSFWDDGYPHGGNYWSAYEGVDLYSGPYQNETGRDGIGDVPYVINANNTDNYPLMEPWCARIKLGALLPLTGALATFGEDDLVAAEFAVEEVNALFEHMGVDRTLSLFVEDTQTNPDIALEKVEHLAAMGIELLVGPISSPEVGAIKDYCDANEILAISHGSTSPDLAVPDDYIFRFSAQEVMGQGPAIGRMIYDDGKRYVIPVTRNDSWGVAIEEAVELKFEGLGGTFLGGIRYPPGETDFSDEAYALSELVADAVYAYGAANVSVLHLSLGEVNAFMTACLAYSVLDDVKWYGSEGTCRNGAMLEDPDVRDFAMSVGYPCTLFGPAHSDKWEKVRQYCNATLGRAPEPYAYNVYDIVWVYALSFLEVDAYDGRAFKAVLPTVTRNYFGASGWIELDENGDRKGGDYDVWQIAEIAPSEYDWELVGRYIFATDSLVWSPFTLTPVYVFEPIWNRRIFYVVTESNSTVSSHYFNPEEEPVIRFDVTGPNGTGGFCRVAIPRRLLWVEERNWTVLVDGDPVEVTMIEEDDYYTHLHFAYSHSAKTVQIIGTHVVGERSPIVSTESTSGSCNPSLAVDSGGNVHVAWYDYTSYGGSGSDTDIFYKRFVLGWGWTITEVVSTESTASSFAPSLAVDLSGNIHVAWSDYTDLDSGTDIDIFYKRYEVGSGWTGTTVVSTNSTDNSWNPSLAVESSGNIHIAWYDWTNYTGCGTDADIFYKRYEVGSGWTPTEVISTESNGSSSDPSLAVDSSGNVHVAWSDYTDLDSGTDVDIFYKRYEVGSGWTNTTVVSTNSTDESVNPSLAVDSGGNVHVAWSDYTDYMGCGIDFDIFYKRYEVGSGWTNTIVVSKNSTAFSRFPSLAVDLAGNVHVAWYDVTDLEGESDAVILYKRYEVGSGWTNTTVVSTESPNASRMPSLAVDLAGNVHVAWEDATDYMGCGIDSDIFYKYLRLHSTQYPWSMFRHDLRHTGYTESPAPNTNQTLWTYTTSGYVISSPAVAGGKVYVGSRDNKTYCLDAFTGALIWDFTTGGWVHSSPAVVGGKVYVGSYDKKVYCLDASNGALIWNYTTEGRVSSSPAVVDGRVYVGSWDNRVYCLNALNGAKMWDYPTGGMMAPSSPAVAGGRVFVGSTDNKTYCLDAFTGALVWSFTTGNYIVSSPAVVDGRVFVGSTDNKTYCLDAFTGALVWNFTTGSYVSSSPAVADDKVYVGSEDGNVYCLDALNRTKIWNYTTGASIAFSSPAVAGGKVFVGSTDNKTYCLDAFTGALIWNFTTGNYVRSSPAVADGVVFVGSDDGVIYAFGNVIRVPEDYPTIQEAIDAATPGATIIIAPGTYNESLVIDKRLTILGRPGSSTDFAGGGSGIAVTILPEASGTIVTNIIMTNWDQGIFIDDASECKIYDNTMYLMGDSGIVIDGDNAANNLVYSNTICSNNIAIDLAESSTGNIIYANTISDNDIGINLLHSSGNTIYWNSFVNNLQPVNASNPSSNTWDNGYPSGGNYWSDYTGADVNSGPNQDQPGSDGIGDTPYNINGSEQDNYPLMSPHEYWSNPTLGDINKDTKVDDKDLLQLAAAYGSTPGKSNWNPNCDFNEDYKVEVLDLFNLGKNYGKNEP